MTFEIAVSKKMKQKKKEKKEAVYIENNFFCPVFVSFAHCITYHVCYNHMFDILLNVHF